MTMQGNDFLSLKEFGTEQIRALITQAVDAKKGGSAPRLSGKTLISLFFNSSLRTRISFQTAMEKLGGSVITINVGSDLWKLEFEPGAVMDGNTTEHITDAARVLERYADFISVRAFPRFRSWEEDEKDAVLQSFAAETRIPVINMESAMFHPCQGLADAMTITERLGEPRGEPFLLTWTWHPKALPLSVTHSALLAAAHLGMEIRLAHPEGYEPAPDVLRAAEETAEKNGGSLTTFHDQMKAAEGARVVYAKSWTSRRFWSDHAQEIEHRKPHRSWQVTERLMSAGDTPFFMHCLPVRRNVVVADSVIDGPHCAVYDEAENRMWVQLAILNSLV